MIRISMRIFFIYSFSHRRTDNFIYGMDHKTLSRSKIVFINDQYLYRCVRYLFLQGCLQYLCKRKVSGCDYGTKGFQIICISTCRFIYPAWPLFADPIIFLHITIARRGFIKRNRNNNLMKFIIPSFFNPGLK